MQYSEIIAVCSEILTKRKHTVWAECGIVDVKLAVRAGSTGPSNVNSVKSKGVLVYAVMAYGGLDV